ncbi:MAG TPA: dihydrodipicolinate reductase C-terminal domain-containing protein [Pyrinomonadaceae bacterium]|jgi:4-hydroxy-tetrahydrodipicolinate reductase|nr:dihydrodipicolinate reductase C-terminal domain-containing protein [Pyrinomonadaceae bacterium]
MRLALIGNGAMGRMVAAEAHKRGDEIGAVIGSNDRDLSIGQLADKLRGHDAAIDFSVGDTVLKNIEACARAQVPIVEGTTGWKDKEPEAKQIVAEHHGALVYGANFSIGVNLFYRLTEHAAKLFAAVEGYDPFIEEAHHNRKKDAPSGTALKLRDIMSVHLDGSISTSSTRAGHIPGTHRVGFDSEPDQVLLTHTARSRQGFASGALVAAHWIVGRTGTFEFSEVIDELIAD